LGPKYKVATGAKDKEQNSNNTSQPSPAGETAAQQLRSIQLCIFLTLLHNWGAQTKSTLIISKEAQNTPLNCLGQFVQHTTSLQNIIYSLTLVQAIHLTQKATQSDSNGDSPCPCHAIQNVAGRGDKSTKGVMMIQAQTLHAMLGAAGHSGFLVTDAIAWSCEAWTKKCTCKGFPHCTACRVIACFDPDIHHRPRHPS
jgi:hypothetical protein